MRELELGPDHPYTAVTVNDLGAVLFGMGRYEEARRHFERALQIRMKWAPDHLDTARSLGNLGTLLWKQGTPALAKPYLEQALAIREEALPENDSDTANVLRSIAGVAFDLDLHDDALEAYERVLAIRTAGLGPSNPTALANAYVEFAILLEAQVQVEEALAYYAKALAILQRQPSPDDQLILTAQRRSGMLHLRSERFETARGLLQAAEFRLAKSRPEEDTDLQEVRLALATVHRNLHDHDRAIELAGEVLFAREEALGPTHAGTLVAKENLAMSLNAGADPEYAEVLFEEIRLASREARTNLADTLEEWGQEARATEIRSQEVDSGADPVMLLWDSPAEDGRHDGRDVIVIEATAIDFAGIKDVRIHVNEEVISARGAGRLVDLEDGRAAKVELTIPFPPRQAPEGVRIRLQAEGYSGSSDLVERWVTYQVRHELYVLALGVADYRDDGLDLQFPVDDASALVRRLQMEKGGLYDDVHCRILRDEEVTTTAVRRELTRFLGGSKHPDTVVVFVAGHGIRTDRGTYYFLTHEATPADPEEGIIRDDLERLVSPDEIDAHRRVLLIDTCYAGSDFRVGLRGGERGIPVLESGPEETPFAQSASGLYVLGACAADGQARERDGHGLFTSALLGGLSGEADRDGSGTIELWELWAHVESVVRAESGGRQAPSMGVVKEGEDFPLARAR